MYRGKACSHPACRLVVATPTVHRRKECCRTPERKFDPGARGSHKKAEERELEPAGSRFNELVDSVGSQTQCQLAPPFFLQEETSYAATLSSLSAPRKTMLVLAALGYLTRQVASCPRGAEPVQAFGVRVFRLADCVQVGAR